MASRMWIAGGRSGSGVIASAAKSVRNVNHQQLSTLRNIMVAQQHLHQQHQQRRPLSSKGTAATKSTGKGQSVGGEKQKKKATGESTRGQTIEILQKFIDTAEKAKAIDLEFSEEELAEHARVGLEYNRQTTIRVNKQGNDLSTKIWLQQEAMRALPPELRTHAETIDETPPPSDRPWPIWMTPPIKGFNPRDYMGNKGDDDDDEDDVVVNKKGTDKAPSKDAKPAKTVASTPKDVSNDASIPTPTPTSAPATTPAELAKKKVKSSPNKVAE